MSANLHSRPTAAEIARTWNISRRQLFMARELLRTGREDLCAEVEAGRLTLLAALKQAKPTKYARVPDHLTILRRAWIRATDEERRAFAAWVNS